MDSLKYLFYIAGLFLLIDCAEGKREHKESVNAEVDIENKSKSRGPQKNIIVYGSMECNHCHEFRRKLESKGITYEFRDVDENDAYFIELQNLIRSINFKGYVSYPVVNIEGEVYVKPDFRDVEVKMFSDSGK
ncbi:MAG: glutaredoxin family protein [Cyclobacteriaceae bacterium]|jgi:glutaredoxin